MWKDSIRNIVVIFQPNILRIVGFYVRHSAIVLLFDIFYYFMTKFDDKGHNTGLTLGHLAVL